VDDLGADVFAFGLLTSFQGELFDGTRRLLELADERVEVQVEARCWCGERATHNARLVDGVQVYDGELFVVDDPEDYVVTYELRCRRHWISGDSGVQWSPELVTGSVAEVTQDVV
jgi:thymidine kinase